MYVTGLFLEVNYFGFAIVTINNNVLISLPFYSFFLKLGQLIDYSLLIYI